MTKQTSLDYEWSEPRLEPRERVPLVHPRVILRVSHAVEDVASVLDLASFPEQPLADALVAVSRAD